MPEKRKEHRTKKPESEIKGFKPVFPFGKISPQRTQLINQHMLRMREEIDAAKKYPIEVVKERLNQTLLQKGIDLFAPKKTKEIGIAVQSLKTISFFFNEFANSANNLRKRREVLIQIKGFLKPSDFLWANYSEKEISEIFSKKEIQEDKSTTYFSKTD